MKIIPELPPEAKKGQLVSLDIEMFGQEKGKLHRPTGTFALISATMDGKNVYQVYDHHDLKKFFAAVSKGTWVFHNSLYDLRQLRRWATINPRFIWDIMLVDQSVYGGYYQKFSLKDMVRRYLREYMEKETRENFETDNELTPQMKKYAALDAVDTWKIARIQQDLSPSDLKVYLREDEPMIFPVLDMQGMRVDVGAWQAALVEFDRKAKEAEAELGFNSKSVPQTQIALKKAGLYLEDTGAVTLSMYKDRPVVAKILEARMYRDACSKYGEKWLHDHVEADGKVYPSYHITGAETGRMSSSNPNGQNIPQRKMPIYRTFFVPSPGNVMMVSDAASQEPCVLAFESQDKNLLKALQGEISVHMAVAREIYHDETISSKDDDRYKVGKAINLGMSYGLSPYGLATRLNMTEQEATEIVNHYFNKFPGVLLYIGMHRQFAFNNGYVKTASGRKVYVSIYDRQWENNAINAPIQGGAVAQTKRWTRLYWEMCRSEKQPYCLTGIIHDEQTKDVPKEIRKDQVKLNDAAFLQSAHELFPGIPFRVETEIGKSWAAKGMKEELLDDEEEEE